MSGAAIGRNGPARWFRRGPWEAGTMTLIAEAMGFTLPNAASIPAMDSAHTRMASESGARIVEMIAGLWLPRRALNCRSGFLA